MSTEHLFDRVGILQTAAHNFRASAARLKLQSSLVERLLYPKEKIEITVSPVLSNHKPTLVRAYLVRHNDTLGPSKGGIRMTSDVSLDDVTGLAIEMTWKSSLYGVPFGGGKMGICWDASTSSAEDKEIILRSVTRAFLRQIGPEIYVPAPDMGTDETDMGFIRDCISYSSGISITRGCYVTGKPAILGGIRGRKEATGKGVLFNILAAAEKRNVTVSTSRIALQGLGNVGSVVARELAKRGASFVALGDSSESLYEPAGFDIEDVLAYVDSTGQLKEYPVGKRIPSADLFTVDCDILVPAGGPAQITDQNADGVQARIIAEGANSPSTPIADEMLSQKDIFMIPDILCNGGAVYVSYLEYTQETQRSQMTLRQVEQQLRERTTEKFNEVFDYAQGQSLSMRQAALDVAVKRVAEGVIARGLLP